MMYEGKQVIGYICGGHRRGLSHKWVKQENN